VVQKLHQVIGGRFLAQDPMGFNAGGTNFYAYLSNRPVNLVDPTGLIPLSKLECYLCKLLPRGRAMGVGGYVGAVGSVGYSLELVVNYDSGEASGFATGGIQGGWNGVGTGTVFSGLIYGPLGNSNEGYSGGFSGQGASAPLPIEPQLSGGAYHQGSGNGVSEYGLNLGVSALGRYGFGYNWTKTSPALPLGKYWLYAPDDWLIWAARRVLCK